MAGQSDDDLLRPTLAQHAPPIAGGRRPWRLGSQVYVAFFGGPVAVTAIALLNARRLRLDRRASGLIAVCGVAGLVGTVVLALAVDDLPSAGRRVVALVAWGGMYLVQRTADRSFAFHAHDDEDYASLWLPGILAVIAGNGALALALYAATGSAL